MDTDELIGNRKIKVEDEEEDYEESFARTYSFHINQETAGESINHNNSISIKTEESQTILVKQCLIDQGIMLFNGKCCSQKRHFVSNEALHKGTDVKSLKCDGCEKSFSSKWNYKDHMMSHYGIKSFQCQKCGELFTLETVLKQHM